MIRTEIVLCCDSCKKRLEKYDSVYGYISGLNSNPISITVPSANDEIYLHEECLLEIKDKLIQDIKNAIKESKPNGIYIKIPELKESYDIKPLSFSINSYKNYYYLSIGKIDYLFEYDRKHDTYDGFSNFEIDFMNQFAYGKLDFVKSQLEAIRRNATMASQIAMSSASAISSKDYNHSDYNDISSITTLI